MKNVFRTLALPFFLITTACSQNASPEDFIGSWAHPSQKGTVQIGEREGVLIVILGDDIYPGKISGDCIVFKNKIGQEIKICLENENAVIISSEKNQDVLFRVQSYYPSTPPPAPPGQ